MSDIEIICGDCLEKLPEIGSNTVDTVITDPPYNLGFMGKQWDTIRNFQEWVESWARECLRILKPGGTMLCFGGTRTFHRATCGIEDAGFELKDVIMYVYGSGFPKATDISKQLDKGHEREVIGIAGKSGSKRNAMNGDFAGGEYMSTLPATPEAHLWNGWKSHGLKPAYEPILVCMKPNDGSYAENALKWGVSGLWIDGGRIEVNENEKESFAKEWDREQSMSAEKGGVAMSKGLMARDLNEFRPSGRFPANIILDEEAGKMLDEQSGVSKSRGGPANTDPTNADSAIYGFAKYPNMHKSGAHHSDSGGASRFFYRVDNDCSLCYNTNTKTINTESELWKRLYVNSAEENLKIITETDPFIARLSAMQRASERFVQNVKSAGNLCDICAISIAHALVGIKNSDFKTEELQAILGYIGSCKSSILIQNLVNYAELWASTVTTPTTNNLSVLFGSVHHAIRNYTPETEKSEPKRFKYTPKASKAERNAGCEGMEERMPTHGKGNEKGGLQVSNSCLPKQNHHPTVKPLALMEYLCKLTKTPTGGVVLDPFMGSGTTGCACVKTGRDFIGIEKELEFVEIAENRIHYWEDQQQQEKEKMGLFENL